MHIQNEIRKARACSYTHCMLCVYGPWSEFIWKSRAAGLGQFEKEASEEVWLQQFVKNVVTARVVFICWISDRVAVSCPRWSINVSLQKKLWDWGVLLRCSSITTGVAKSTRSNLKNYNYRGLFHQPYTKTHFLINLYWYPTMNIVLSVTVHVLLRKKKLNFSTMEVNEI